MMYRGLSWALALMCLASLASGQAAKSVDIGYDVGDGSARYDTPYNPKQVRDITFVSPTAEHPYYEIVVPMGDWSEGPGARVDKLRVNGMMIDSYYVFVDGISHVQSPWITNESATAKNVVVVARAMWHNRQTVSVEIDCPVAATGDSPARTVTKTFSAIAPSQGGGPEGWRRYQSLVLHERAGLDRLKEPVEFTVTVRAEDCVDLDKELRLFTRGDEKMPWSPVDVQTFSYKLFPGTPPGTSNDNYLQHPSKSLEAIFLASVPARKSRVYLVVYDNPEAPTPVLSATDLKVEGPSLGATIENEYYTMGLDKRSGQIAYVELRSNAGKPVPRLTNSYSYAAHWNPDSFSDNGKWGHTFAWNPPDSTVVTARGPILFRITNSGRMPDLTPQVHASVTYSFYAGVPYVRTTTVMEVRDPLNADALRNGELVLDSHLVTHFVWREKTGELHTIGTLHGPNWQDEWTTRVDHDVPWIAMTNELDDYGIGAIVEESLAFNPRRGEATTHRVAYYLYYHHMWQIPVTYFTRGWMYPFSDYQRGPIIPVEPSSTYVEKEAFMPFLLKDGKGRYQAIDHAAEQLEHPLVQRWGR